VSRLQKTSDDIEKIEKSLVKSFLANNGIDYNNSKFLSGYLNGANGGLYNKIESIISDSGLKLDLDSFIILFELLIPKDEKKENGMVYTPKEIKEFIISNLANKYQNGELSALKIIDPSCGCGSFLLTAVELIHQKTKKKPENIIEDQIYGIDIFEHNITKTKVLLSLLCLSIQGKENIRCFNLESANSLDVNIGTLFKDKTKKFDLVIGNPPYVRTKNLRTDIRASMDKWESAQSGLPDIYIPFYELGIKILNDKGKLGYISINTFLRGLNGRNIRRIFSSKGYELDIVDFSDYQVFKGVTSYTSIILLDKGKIGGKINYSRCKNPEKLRDIKYTPILYSDLDDKRGWVLGNQAVLERIRKIETVGFKLGSKFLIRNGIATLANDLFIFSPIDEDDTCFYRDYNGKRYAIEKEICIDIVKPNTINDEEDMENKIEKLISPYESANNKNVVLNEKSLQEKYPKTHYFFKDNRDVLERRDKGKGKYPVWYAFGRAQGLNNFGSKILFPYMAGKPKFFISSDKDMLFYCGYAIFVDDDRYRQVLKKILLSDIFWYYIKNVSKPYSSGYMSLAKNYVVNFGIPNLSESEMKKIDGISDSDELNRFLEQIYFGEN
jgi:type I restriction-modification system DNA methylase subunit